MKFRWKCILGLRTTEFDHELERLTSLPVVITVSPSATISYLGETIDINSQSPHEPSHLIEYGVWKMLLHSAYSSLTYTQQAKFDCRFRNIIWPNGWNECQFDFSATIGSNYSMRLYRRTAPICLIANRGLFNKDHAAAITALHRFIADFHAFRFSMLPQLTLDVQSLIKLLVPLIGTTSNVHGLEEIVRELGIWYRLCTVFWHFLLLPIFYVMH